MLDTFTKLTRTDSLEYAVLDIPEKRLMLAVLEDAINQYRINESLEAKRWLQSDSRMWAYSFVNICEVLDLEPSYLRKGLLVRVRSSQDADTDRRRKGHLRRHRQI